MSDLDTTKSQFVSSKFKKRQIRSRNNDSSDEEKDGLESEVSGNLEDMKIIQKLRQRPRGVDIAKLALGNTVSRNQAEDVSDPFRVKSGGMLNMNALKKGDIKKVDDAYDTGIGTQFSAETNKRDEDEEMMKYIENELTQRKLKVKTESNEGDDDNFLGKSEKYCSPEEAALQAVPVHLRASSTQKSEEMLSNQMLSGIPEVDLGIDAKIKNIEATEEAKLKLLWNSHNKKEGPSQFVPTNIAVNFVQHNRFSMAESRLKKPQPVVPEVKPITKEMAPPEPVDSKKRKDDEKATDDYYYERFRKQFRRF